jgi:hypothetical protein
MWQCSCLTSPRLLNNSQTAFRLTGLKTKGVELFGNILIFLNMLSLESLRLQDDIKIIYS